MRIALIAVAALLLAGCYPTPVQPNDLDTERLATLAAEPLLAGGTEHPAAPNRTSANANASRAHVTVGQVWSAIDTSNTWVSAQELMGELRDENWVVITQNCKATPQAFTSAEIIALKELDDFTAGVVIKLDDEGAYLDAFAPFHEEEANPWGPLNAQADGCLDAPVEPVTNTTTTTRTTVGLWYFRD